MNMVKIISFYFLLLCIELIYYLKLYTLIYGLHQLIHLIVINITFILLMIVLDIYGFIFSKSKFLLIKLFFNIKLNQNFNLNTKSKFYKMIRMVSFNPLPCFLIKLLLFIIIHVHLLMNKKRLMNISTCILLILV